MSDTDDRPNIDDEPDTDNDQNGDEEGDGDGPSPDEPVATAGAAPDRESLDGSI